MRYLTIAAAALLGVSMAAARAQPAPDTASGGRPGHEPGTGLSFPLSSSASNIGPSDTRSVIAPTLPPSSVGTNATVVDYLRAARASLMAGETGQTQQSLEMAETRALDRSVPMGTTDSPDPSGLIARIRDARHALGAGDRQQAIQIIDSALLGAG
jgi:hypothetical protein